MATWMAAGLFRSGHDDMPCHPRRARGVDCDVFAPERGGVPGGREEGLVVLSLQDAPRSTMGGQEAVPDKPTRPCWLPNVSKSWLYISELFVLSLFRRVGPGWCWFSSAFSSLVFFSFLFHVFPALQNHPNDLPNSSPIHFETILSPPTQPVLEEPRLGPSRPTQTPTETRTPTIDHPAVLKKSLSLVSCEVLLFS